MCAVGSHLGSLDRGEAIVHEARGVSTCALHEQDVDGEERILVMSENVIYIDDTDVEIDNRDLGETELRYKDQPGVVYSVSIRFAFELVKNAIENHHDELSVETTALDVLERALGCFDDDCEPESPKTEVLCSICKKPLSEREVGIKVSAHWPCIVKDAFGTKETA